jgi:preprotein translocase subunit SecG
LTKTTWATATVFFLTSITLAYLSSSSDEALQKKSAQLAEKSKPVPVPAPPSTPK